MFNLAQKCTILDHSGWGTGEVRGKRCKPCCFSLFQGIQDNINSRNDLYFSSLSNCQTLRGQIAIYYFALLKMIQEAGNSK